MKALRMELMGFGCPCSHAAGEETASSECSYHSTSSQSCEIRADNRHGSEDANTTWALRHSCHPDGAPMVLLHPAGVTPVCP